MYSKRYKFQFPTSHTRAPTDPHHLIYISATQIARALLCGSAQSTCRPCAAVVQCCPDCPPPAFLSSIHSYRHSRASPAPHLIRTPPVALIHVPHRRFSRSCCFASPDLFFIPFLPPHNHRKKCPGLHPLPLRPPHPPSGLGALSAPAEAARFHRAVRRLDVVCHTTCAATRFPARGALHGVECDGAFDLL